MKSVIIVIVLFLLGLLSCNNCEYLECKPPFDMFRFNYISKNNEDLLGGTSQKYSTDEVKFYSLSKDKRKMFHDISIISQPAPDLSIVEVYLRSNFERNYLELKGVVTDTIDFRLSESDSKCCGVITTIQEIQLDGIVYTNDTPIIIIEK